MFLKLMFSVGCALIVKIPESVLSVGILARQMF